VTVTAQVAIAQIIAEDDNEIGFLRGRFACAGLAGANATRQGKSSGGNAHGFNELAAVHSWPHRRIPLPADISYPYCHLTL
jgi:hypothetical protein